MSQSHRSRRDRRRISPRSLKNRSSNSQLSFQQLEARRLLAADLRFVLGASYGPSPGLATPSELLQLNNDSHPDFVVVNLARLN
jgi:hypothetical protein